MQCVPAVLSSTTTLGEDTRFSFVQNIDSSSIPATAYSEDLSKFMELISETADLPSLPTIDRVSQCLAKAAADYPYPSEDLYSPPLLALLQSALGDENLRVEPLKILCSQSSSSSRNTTTTVTADAGLTNDTLLYSPLLAEFKQPIHTNEPLTQVAAYYVKMVQSQFESKNKKTQFFFTKCNYPVSLFLSAECSFSLLKSVSLSRYIFECRIAYDLFDVYCLCLLTKGLSFSSFHLFCVYMTRRCSFVLMGA
jgi:hypothetical protein